jgi:hypothetical protein
LFREEHALPEIVLAGVAHNTCGSAGKCLLVLPCRENSHFFGEITEIPALLSVSNDMMAGHGPLERVRLKRSGPAAACH